MNLYIKKRSFLDRKIFIGSFVLFFSILFLNIFQAPIRESFYFMSMPVSIIFSDAGKVISGSLQSFIKYKSLKKENNGLREENQKLWSHIAALQGTALNDQALKRALQNTKDDNFKIVLARIIGIDAANDFILIDKGSDQGIAEKMPLISPIKVLYGTVFKAYKNFSQVMLISHPGSAVDVKVFSHNDFLPGQALEESGKHNGEKNDQSSQPPIYGAVKGGGGLSLYLDSVNSESSISSGDVLMTSALEGIYPKDLLVGAITSVMKDDLKPFQGAKIYPFFDIAGIENLFVITDYMKK